MTFWDTIGNSIYDLTINFISIPRLLCLSALLIGYLFGLFQSAYIISRIKHVDIYSQGSGNPGATNMFRVMGPVAGILTFLLDIAKVVGAIFLTKYIFLTWLQLPIDPIALTLYTGFGAVLGHNFPIYLRGKGGKGVVATCAAIVCIGEWKYVIVGLAVFLLVVLVTGYVSFASMCTVIVLMFEFLLMTLMNYTYVDPYWLTDCHVIMILFAVLVLVTHRTNIYRLLTGEENRFSFRRSKAAEEEADEEEGYEEEELSEDGGYENEEPDEESQKFLDHADSLFEEHAELLAEIEKTEKENAKADAAEETSGEADAAEETSGEAASSEETSEKAASEEKTAEEKTSEEAASAEAAAEEKTSEEAASDAGDSEETASDESASSDDKEPAKEEAAAVPKKPTKEERIAAGTYRTNHNKAAQPKKKKKHSSTKKKKSSGTKKKRK